MPYISTSDESKRDSTYRSDISHIMRNHSGPLHLKTLIDTIVGRGENNPAGQHTLKRFLGTLNAIKPYVGTQITPAQFNAVANEVFGRLDLSNINNKEQLLAKYPEIGEGISAGLENVLPARIIQLYQNTAPAATGGRSVTFAPTEVSSPHYLDRRRDELIQERDAKLRARGEDPGGVKYDRIMKEFETNIDDMIASYDSETNALNRGNQGSSARPAPAAASAPVPTRSAPTPVITPQQNASAAAAKSVAANPHRSAHSAVNELMGVARSPLTQENVRALDESNPPIRPFNIAPSDSVSRRGEGEARTGRDRREGESVNQWLARIGSNRPYDGATPAPQTAARRSTAAPSADPQTAPGSSAQTAVGYAIAHPQAMEELGRRPDPATAIPTAPRMPRLAEETQPVAQSDGTFIRVPVDPEVTMRSSALNMLNEALNKYNEENLLPVNAPESVALQTAIESLYSKLRDQARPSPQEQEQMDFYSDTVNNDTPSLERTLASELHAPVTEEEMKAYEDPYKNDVISDMQRRALERFKEEESDRRRDQGRNIERMFGGSGWNSGARRVKEREFEEMERRRARDFDDNLNTQIRLALQHGNHEAFGRLMQMRNLKNNAVSHHKNLTQDEFNRQSTAADKGAIAGRDIATRQVAQYDTAAQIFRQRQRDAQERRDRDVAEQHRRLNQGINHATTALAATGRVVQPVQYQQPLPQMPMAPQRSGWGDAVMTANGMYHQQQAMQQQNALMQAQTQLAQQQAQAVQQRNAGAQQ